MNRRMRPLGWSYHPGHSTPVDFSDGWGTRPCGGYTVPLADRPYSLAGPAFKGMDPSDPATYTRPWNPQPGMIAYLNFDGAAMQARTPTGGVQRGRQQRPNKLRMFT